MSRFRRQQTRNVLAATVTALGLTAAQPAVAGNDPACAGSDQSVCDTLGAMINAKGRGCYRMLLVQPTGSDGYGISCEVSSTDRSRVSYTLQFSADRTTYTLN